MSGAIFDLDAGDECFVCGKPFGPGCAVAPPETPLKDCIIVHGGHCRRKAERWHHWPAAIAVSAKDLDEGRLVRDAERAEPGIVRRTLDELLAAGKEPTKAALYRALRKAVRGAPRIPGNGLPSG